MMSLPIGPELVGRKVSVPNRPEWGAGSVLRVQTTVASGAPVHRVTIQFPHGTRTLVSPPAILVDPMPEVERSAGWLDTIGGRTVDDRLGKLPFELEHFLGTPAQWIAALAPLFSLDSEDPIGLVKWAKKQTNAADPLSLWSRDELQLALRQFCTERDSALRVAFARMKDKEGPGAIEETLRRFDPPIAAAMRTAIQRPL